MPRLRAVPWRRVLAEFIAIFAGVFMGLFADQWWQDRADRSREIGALQDMLAELQEDADDLERISQRAHAWSESGLWMVQHRGADLPPDSVWAALSPLFFRDSYDPRSAAYTSLRDAGQLALISDPALRRQVVEYFETGQAGAYRHYLRALAMFDDLLVASRPHFEWSVASDAKTLYDGWHYSMVRPWAQTSRDRLLTGAMLNVALFGTSLSERLDSVVEQNRVLRRAISDFTVGR